MTEQNSIEKRKAEHIKMVAERDVSAKGTTTGLERFHFIHNALPELDFNAIQTNTAFLDKQLKAPLMISSMTGGTKQAEQINQFLARAAEAQGWALGTGSSRAALENEDLQASFKLRHYAPNIPILANLGAVQLNKGYDVSHCQRAVELVEADALILHLNSLQEVIQHEGDTDFSGLLRKIEKVCRALDVPIGVKEVGWGIEGQTARRLLDAGVTFIDVAGAGGTSWSEVEKQRTQSPIKAQAADAIAGWGNPTAECIQSVREENPQTTVVASGGLRTGVDAAKSIALGADLAAFGRSLLKDALDSYDAVLHRLKQTELELRIAMFGIGAENILALKQTDRLDQK